MKITIKRYRQKGKTTDGHLYADDDYVCDTAENTRYCISPGTYQVTLVKDRRLGRKVPCLRHDSQLRFGNGVYTLRDSTILVGTFIAPGCLSHSRETFDVLYERIRKTIERGNKVILTIE